MITFTEVPDELSLCINCTCCPLRCKECFEPWLQEDRGVELTFAEMDDLLHKCRGVTCVCFMGGINDYHALYHLMAHVKYKGFKVAVYSGHPHMQPGIMEQADYYKVGPYMPEYGGLDKLTTNQHFWKKEKNNEWVDITYKFQKERI